MSSWKAPPASSGRSGVEGAQVFTRYGRIGSEGATSLKDEGDPAKAKKLYDKLIAEKTKKGYQEVGAQAAPKTSAPKPPAPAAKTPDPKKYAAQIAKITASAKKGGFKLPAGATEAEIAQAEAALGVTFPPEVRAFYLTHDGGSDDEVYNCGGRELLSLDGIVSQWKIWKQLLDSGTFEKNDHGAPDPGVQKKWWIAEWIPVTYDGAGNHHILDLAPAKGGKVGQILSFWHDDAPRTLEAPDFLTWLSQVEWSEDPDGDDESDDESDDGEGGAWRRFEMDEKFWAIKKDGASFTVKYGKIGTDGQEKTKDFEDEDAADKEYDKLVAEKTKKGYEEVDQD